MQHNHEVFELKFGEATVSVRRRGSSHVLTARILGSESIPDSDRVLVWLDRLVFDKPRIEQEDWQAYGAISTILEVPGDMLEQGA